MGPVIDVEVGQVHQAGRNVSGLSGGAGSVARTFLQAVSDASSEVGHTRVSGALQRFHGTWSVPANRLAHDVDALGQNTSGAAVDVRTGDNDASGQAQTVVATNTSISDRINGGWGIDGSGGAGGSGGSGGTAPAGGESRYASPEAMAAHGGHAAV